MQNTERLAQTFEKTADKLSADAPPSLDRSSLIFKLKMRADQVRAGQGELDEAAEMLKPAPEDRA